MTRSCWLMLMAISLVFGCGVVTLEPIVERPDEGVGAGSGDCGGACVDGGADGADNG